MKKLFSLGVLLMMFASFTYAQTAEIEIVEKEYKFGVVPEEGGIVTGAFEVINTGTAPLVISAVNPSCGCTTPKWTNEPIPPGGKGTIEAGYNPSGRPGPFKKSITVRSNASEPNIVLYISGEVTPRPKAETEN
jgi:hypothetical protein